LSLCLSSAIERMWVSCIGSPCVREEVGSSFLNLKSLGSGFN
jgi:hypothetical protein